MQVYRVQLILGVAEIVLDRQGLELSDRGGFEAKWVDGPGISLESFEGVVKTYLNMLYKNRYGEDAARITLNLAAHQLLDDIVGWSKLNYGNRPL
jgi:hypothetical protein